MYVVDEKRIQIEHPYLRLMKRSKRLLPNPVNTKLPRKPSRLIEVVLVEHDSYTFVLVLVDSLYLGDCA